MSGSSRPSSRRRSSFRASWASRCSAPRPRPPASTGSFTGSTRLSTYKPGLTPTSVPFGWVCYSGWIAAQIAGRPRRDGWADGCGSGPRDDGRSVRGSLTTNRMSPALEPTLRSPPWRTTTALGERPGQQDDHHSADPPQRGGPPAGTSATHAWSARPSTCSSVRHSSPSSVTRPSDTGTWPSQCGAPSPASERPQIDAVLASGTLREGADRERGEPAEAGCHGGALTGLGDLRGQLPG